MAGWETQTHRLQRGGPGETGGGGHAGRNGQKQKEKHLRRGKQEQTGWHRVGLGGAEQGVQRTGLLGREGLRGGLGRKAVQEERIWKEQRRTTKRVGGKLRDKLLQPLHLTLGETEAQAGEALI